MPSYCTSCHRVARMRARFSTKNITEMSQYCFGGSLPLSTYHHTLYFSGKAKRSKTADRYLYCCATRTTATNSIIKHTNHQRHAPCCATLTTNASIAVWGCFCMHALSTCFAAFYNIFRSLRLRRKHVPQKKCFYCVSTLSRGVVQHATTPTFPGVANSIKRKRSLAPSVYWGLKFSTATKIVSKTTLLLLQQGPRKGKEESV